jgi:hypothetical protein
MPEDHVEDLDVTPSDAAGVKGGVGDVNGDIVASDGDGDVAKKLPGKRTPPTVTLKRGKNQSMEL